MKSKKGFTLIELMITVGIVGILVLMAYPYYKSYTMRVYITEGISLLSQFDGELLEMASEGTPGDGEYPVHASSGPINKLVTGTNAGMVMNAYYGGKFLHTGIGIDSRLLSDDADGLGMSVDGSYMATAFIERMITKESAIGVDNYGDGTYEALTIRGMTNDELNDSSNFKIICGVNSLNIRSSFNEYMKFLPKECRRYLYILGVYQ